VHCRAVFTIRHVTREEAGGGGGDEEEGQILVYSFALRLSKYTEMFRFLSFTTELGEGGGVVVGKKVEKGHVTR